MYRFVRVGLLLTCLIPATIGAFLSASESDTDKEYPWTYLTGDGKVRSPQSDFVGYSYEAMWNVRKDPDELLHVIFFPFGTSVGVTSSFGLGRSPSKIHISSYPDGLYLKGKRVCRGNGRRVFVYTKERKLRVIPLKEKELKPLLPENIDKLYAAKVWKEKIKPVLIEEAWMQRTDLGEYK